MFIELNVPGGSQDDFSKWEIRDYLNEGQVRGRTQLGGLIFEYYRVASVAQFPPFAVPIYTIFNTI